MAARLEAKRSTALIGIVTLVISLMAVALPARAESPTLCGRVTLVLDESGSIDGFETPVRDALRAFLDPLTGYAIEASIIEFGTSATSVFGFTPITPANVTSVFGPYIANEYDAPSQLGGWTNWEDALDVVSNMPELPQLVLFLTDGDPTAYNGPSGVITSADPVTATARAVDEADQIRSLGSRILAVAVGGGITNPESLSRLQQVAGPDVYPDDGPLDLSTTDVVRVPDFDDLPAAMTLIAQAMCADPGLTVEKTVDQPLVSIGTTVIYQIVVTNTGTGTLSNVEVTDPLVPECSKTIGQLAEGESTSFTCTTAIWGPLTNTATATGTDPFGTPVSDDDSAEVRIIPPGTGTPGYWKNHSDRWPSVDNSIYIGDWNHNWACDGDETCLGLTNEDALAALSTPPKGDMTWNLARALVAAWLNVSSGNESWCVAETIDLATGWLITHGLGGGVSGGDDAWREASSWAAILDDYNNGRLCAESRDSGGSEVESSAGPKPAAPNPPTGQQPAPPPDQINEDSGVGPLPEQSKGKGKALGRDR